MGKHAVPSFELTAFNCPHCNAYAKQYWGRMEFLEGTGGSRLNASSHAIYDFFISDCAHCSKPSIWHRNKLVYPSVVTAPPPNSDLPGDIKDDFEEARQIFELSPRGAAALLRLALQKLCKHLGEPGQNLNADIKALVVKGLPGTVQKAFDIVRVLGNESVHPGTIDLRDDRPTAIALFKLLNFVAEKLITEPKEIADIYGNLPGDKLKGIEERDK